MSNISKVQWWMLLISSYPNANSKGHYDACEGESFKTTRNRSYREGMSQIAFLFKSFNNIFFALPGHHEANLPCTNWRRPQKQTRSFLQTRSSPAAIDEVIHELCDNSSRLSTCITHRETRVHTILVLLFQISFSSLVAAKKWKRANSNTSQSAQISDPNCSSQLPLPLGTRLSTPTMIESKNTRKWHLRQECQQQKGGPAADSVSSAACSSFSAHSIRHGSNTSGYHFYHKNKATAYGSLCISPQSL